LKKPERKELVKPPNYASEGGLNWFICLRQSRRVSGGKKGEKATSKGANAGSMRRKGAKGGGTPETHQ